MLGKFRFVFALYCTFVFVSCVTKEGVMIKETPLGISETRRIITSVIGMPRIISENGRELTSQYFDRKGRVDEFKNARERLYSKIIILGERRPYDIQVVVTVQTRPVNGQYEDDSQDERRANELAEKIRRALNESRDKRNIIDDFRPY